ncbi:tetratricopeptide repeat protein [Rheinheimera hassiensis]|uniref:tetratricopeptide repeat protein n=1 Tax=Rheinheimera hassiensis TaxID=1193627 RepID=UPI001F059DE4|nr:tetratricopeptide repeat protein [Rheinheimera hassiensis]
MQQNEPARLFQFALNCYQKQQFLQAKQLCTRLLKLKPNSMDAMHLMALCCSLDAPELAEQYFEQAISQQSTNKAPQKNYANFLLTRRRYNDALIHYKQLYTTLYADTDIAYGIAFIYYQQQQYRAALNTIQKTDIQSSDQIKWLQLSARTLLKLGDENEALQLLHSALKQYPKNTGLLQTKVLVLRQLQQLQQALDCLKKMPDDPVKLYLAGCIHYDLKQHIQAEQKLHQALRLQPDYIDAHEALNKLYWEHGNKSKFLSSFNQALLALPNSLPIYLSYISHLLMAEQVSDAFRLATQALDHFGQQHPLIHALGTIHYKQEDIAHAEKLYLQALTQSPDNVRYLLDTASILMKKEAYNEATDLLERAKLVQPDNQEIWAYLGLCWRLVQDPKHDWLNDYSRLVSIKKLPTPSGYSSFAAFWQELKIAVAKLHITEHQPLDQSVRNGSQTVGFLFNTSEKVIQVYHDLLTAHLQQYVENLPKDESHPLLQRNITAFRFSGAWSVKLKSEGFHTNHVHKQGWLSICTYLNVPGSISATDPGRQGWLKLGETSLRLGDRDQAALTICPEEGLCVIFPSYIWHGTLPFNSDEERITLPCDIVPDL